jgi:hypothetical protein
MTSDDLSDGPHAVAADFLCGPEDGGHDWHHHLGPGIPRWADVAICSKCHRIEVDVAALRAKVDRLPHHPNCWVRKTPPYRCTCWHNSVLRIINGDD